MGSLSPFFQRHYFFPLPSNFGVLSMFHRQPSLPLYLIFSPNNFNLFLPFNCNLYAHNPQICLLPSHLSKFQAHISNYQCKCYLCIQQMLTEGKESKGNKHLLSTYYILDILHHREVK